MSRALSILLGLAVGGVGLVVGACAPCAENRPQLPAGTYTVVAPDDSDITGGTLTVAGNGDVELEYDVGASSYHASFETMFEMP
jgi:hypothetical protein